MPCHPMPLRAGARDRPFCLQTLPLYMETPTPDRAVGWVCPSQSVGPPLPTYKTTYVAWHVLFSPTPGNDNLHWQRKTWRQAGLPGRLGKGSPSEQLLNKGREKEEKGWRARQACTCILVVALSPSLSSPLSPSKQGLFAEKKAGRLVRRHSGRLVPGELQLALSPLLWEGARAFLFLSLFVHSILLAAHSLCLCDMTFYINFYGSSILSFCAVCKTFWRWKGHPREENMQAGTSSACKGFCLPRQ